MRDDDWNAAYDAGVYATRSVYKNERTHLMMLNEQLETQQAALVDLLRRVLDEVFPSRDSWGEIFEDELIDELDEALAAVAGESAK